jgi:hypothetical protein
MIDVGEIERIGKEGVILPINFNSVGTCARSKRLL